MDIYNKLPLDTLNIIFDMSDLKTLFKLSITNTFLYNLLKDLKIKLVTLLYGNIQKYCDIVPLYIKNYIFYTLTKTPYPYKRTNEGIIRRTPEGHIMSNAKERNMIINEHLMNNLINEFNKLNKQLENKNYIRDDNIKITISKMGKLKPIKNTFNNDKLNKNMFVDNDGMPYIYYSISIGGYHKLNHNDLNELYEKLNIQNNLYYSMFVIL